MTQEELAEKSGITKWYISKIELGITHPRLETYYNIAQALNVTVDSFIYDNPKNITKSMSDGQKELSDNIVKLLKEYKISKLQNDADS